MPFPKLKVLACAYACEPGKGSEPGVGWNWVKQIARFHEVWVITRANNRDSIEIELSKNPAPDLHFIYVDLSKWLKFWKKGRRGVHLYYFLWQLIAYVMAKRIGRSIHFHIAHHITFGVYSSPSFLSFLPCPLIWGPVGGVDVVPKKLRKLLGFSGRIYELIRDNQHRFRFSCDPFVRHTLRKSSLILGRTSQTSNYLRQFKGSGRVLTMLETGWSSSIRQCKEAGNQRFRILSAGRLIPLKGFNIAIMAFARFCVIKSDGFLEIAGEGHEINKLLTLTENCGIKENVRFLGQLTRIELMRKMAKSSVFLYPSLREGGAWVVMEALATGLPVICLNYSGPGEMVTDDCGIKVKPTTPEQTIKDLSEAIMLLADNPDLRRKMGEAGRKRVQEFYVWEKKGEFIQKLYQEVIEGESTRRS